MLSGLWDRYKLVLARLAVAYPGFKPAWRWLVSVVDWLARYDFVVSSAGGAWTMLEAIFDPPLGLVFFVSLVGLGIMYLDFARILRVRNLISLPPHSLAYGRSLSGGFTRRLPSLYKIERRSVR